MDTNTILMILKAFLIGGLICLVGQILIDLTRLTATKILVLFVVLGVVLGTCGWYDRLVEWAGAGATVPLTGFGNLLVNGVKTAMDSTGWVGIVSGGAIAAAGGISAAIISGFICALVTKSSEK